MRVLRHRIAVGSGVECTDRADVLVAQLRNMQKGGIMAGNGYLRGSEVGFTDFRPDPLYELEKRAIRALDLINVEFTTDPMSVQCFDLRLVKEVGDIVAEQRRLELAGRLPPLLTTGVR
jgi:hypothetical protein